VKHTYLINLLFLLVCLNGQSILGRSKHRPIDPESPHIIIKSSCQNQKVILENSHLQEAPFFYLFDKEFLYKKFLPENAIHYRYNHSEYVQGKTLSFLIQTLIIEIQNGKKEFSDFIILKKRDFDKKRRTGLMVLKFKNYPFVLKLFIEGPDSFAHPFEKGFEPCCFFLMGGGVNRHLCGFTRIKNLENLRAKIKHDPYWAQKVDFPRKWFWLPQNPTWLTLESYNIGPDKNKTITIPATYAIICDHIAIERTFSLHNKEDRQYALALSNFLQQEIDPHINNYVIEQKTKKIIPIDSEHFPSMVGIEHPRLCKSYVEWYSHLSCKMLKDTFGTTKRERRNAQYKRHIPL
jgi:hypothetical protein